MKFSVYPLKTNASQQIMHVPLRLTSLMASLTCLNHIIAPLRILFFTCLTVVSVGICSVCLNRPRIQSGIPNVDAVPHFQTCCNFIDQQFILVFFKPVFL